MPPAVDLVVNTWERDYRQVLAPGRFPELAGQSRFPFARRVALVNNVEDRDDAERRARALVEAGEIDDFAFVADRLPAALAATGLTQRDLEGVRHYSDAPLVAITLDASPWLVYWDAEVRLRQPADWITPSIERMERDPRILVANPAWTDDTLEAETIERDGDFALGLGFSDQLFLVRRAELARPVYRERCVAALRYPLAHVGPVFEARVDAWMRHHGRLRATYTPVTYVHPPGGAGASYPATTFAQRLRRKRNMALLAAVRRSPWKPDCCRYM